MANIDEAKRALVLLDSVSARAPIPRDEQIAAIHAARLLADYLNSLEVEKDDQKPVLRPVDPLQEDPIEVVR